METCAYCGDEIIEDEVSLDAFLFCSVECMERYREESYEDLEEELDF